ncbi:MAG: SDR family oxidoreductase [Pirellulales bacterium]|nr:SDR family oxidoreductase [Pirellulales bacterium]
MQLQGKTALVTGGTRGIGAASAIAFAREGMNVAIAARRNDEQAQETKRKIESLGRQCAMLAADCAKPEDNTRAVEETLRRFSSVDVLLHAAGGPVMGDVLRVPPEDWYRGFDVHVHAVYHLCRAAVPRMQENKEGAIILVSSVAGIRGCPGILCYQAVKGAILQLTRGLARDLAPHNIRVNCVSPGVIETEFHVLAGMTQEQRTLNVEKRIPLGRHGRPEHIAEMVLEMARNDYLTGENVTVDGGLTMRIA